MGLLDRIRGTSSLGYFEFPGGGYSMASLGLDDTLEGSGLSPVATPRHADVLIVGGPVTPKLEEALGLIYAEIPRPRYTLAVGTQETPVPVDATSSPEASDLEKAVRGLRQRIAEGYVGAPPIEEPEDEEEEHEGTEHDEGDEASETGEHEQHAEYGEEQSEGEEEHEGMDHEEMDHEGMDHDHMMMGSMIESEDGLMLEAVNMPLGPVHPATPGGLGLTLTLDGDLVNEAELEDGYLARGVAGRVVRSRPKEALKALRWLDPRTPVSPPMLYARAWENLAGAGISDATRFGRIYLLEIERASSHLLWLSGFARILGVEDAARRVLDARRPLLPTLRAAWVALGGVGGKLVRADLARVKEGFRSALKPLERRGSVLPYRLEGLAVAEDTQDATGPVARASGMREDARIGDADYEALGFEPALGEWGDALARYRVRVREIEESLRLADEALQRAGAEVGEAGELADGEVTEALEGPRGRTAARLNAEGGQVAGFALESPSRANARLLKPLIEGVSLSDAVVALWSLDLSVEEMDG